MKKQIPFFIFLCFLTACDCIDQKEIDGWKWGDAVVGKKCMMPIPVRVKPIVEYDLVEKMSLEINLDIGFRLLEVSRSSGIPIRDADGDSSFPYYCDPLKIGDTFGGFWGWARFEGSPGKYDATVFLCLSKMRAARYLYGTPAADDFRKIKMAGIIKHELVHLLIGPNHPSLGELMGSPQRSTHLSAHTKALIRQKVIGNCR